MHFLHTLDILIFSDLTAVLVVEVLVAGAKLWRDQPISRYTGGSWAKVYCPMFSPCAAPVRTLCKYGPLVGHSLLLHFIVSYLCIPSKSNLPSRGSVDVSEMGHHVLGT